MGSRGVRASMGLVLDLLLGDPPNRWHPVAWYGQAASWCERRLYRDSRLRGTVVWGLAVLPAVLLGALLDAAPAAAPVALAVTLGGRSLATEALAVARLLEAGDLEGSRAQVRRLVGRETVGLSASEVARAAIESVAENATDALVAPWCWFQAAGTAGALLFRAANTMDAMFGHRSSRYRRFGWASARADDLLAAPGALVTVVATMVLRPSRARAILAQLPRARAHPSLNAGLVEAAFAGALGVRLGGVNRYEGREVRLPVLPAGHSPDAAAIRDAVQLLVELELLLVLAGLIR